MCELHIKSSLRQLPCSSSKLYYYLFLVTTTQQFCLESTSTLECKFMLGVMYLPSLMPAVSIHLHWSSFFSDAISATIFLGWSRVFPPSCFSSFNNTNTSGIITSFYSGWWHKNYQILTEISAEPGNHRITGFVEFGRDNWRSPSFLVLKQSHL